MLSTKTESYVRCKQEGLTSRKRREVYLAICDFLSRHGRGPANWEIAKHYPGLTERCVCGRTNELKEMGLIEKGRKSLNQAGSRRVDTWVLTDTDPQHTLWGDA